MADRPDIALREVHGCNGIPDHWGWFAQIEPVFIRWVSPDAWTEENEIEESLTDDDTSGWVEAWRITVEER